jgi:hypothetical protein
VPVSLEENILDKIRRVQLTPKSSANLHPRKYRQVIRVPCQQPAESLVASMRIPD